MPTPRRCSAPPSTAPTFRTWVSPTSPGRGSGRPTSCTGTTTSTGTAASATSPRRSAMPAGTAPSSPPVMRSTSGRARPTRADGAGGPATGRRSAPSRSTPSATASSPPRAPWQAHRLPVGGWAYHRQDRRPHCETSAATTLTRTEVRRLAAHLRLHRVERRDPPQRLRRDRRRPGLRQVEKFPPDVGPTEREGGPRARGGDALVGGVAVALQDPGIVARVNA